MGEFFTFASIVIVIAMAVGYVLNMVKLARNRTNFTGLDGLRMIGIVIPPIGSVIGYASNVEKETNV